MNIDAATFRSIAKTLLPEAVLQPDEAAAIIYAAQLAAGIDFRGDVLEDSALRQLEQHVAALAGLARENITPASPLPLDAEERRAWIAGLAETIRTPEAADLAYVVAYLVALSDLAVAPLEDSFVEELRTVLGIDRARAADLVVTVSSLLTPGVRADVPRRTG